MKRAHFDVQISLLPEQEVTRAIRMLERISVTAIGGLSSNPRETLRPEERDDGSA